MPPSEAQRAVEELAERMKSLDSAVSANLIREYGSVYQQLSSDTNKLLATAKRRALKPWEVMKLGQMQGLEEQFKDSVVKFSRSAGDSITTAQRAAVGLANEGSARVASAGLPRGINQEMLGRLGLGWNRLPEEAMQAFIGISGEGKPIGNLLAPLGDEAATGVKSAIRSGIATGRGPREVARGVRNAAGMPLSKALTISRTEVNRAHREATRLNYAANSNVIKGYRRLATKDSRTCMACIALDGTLYEVKEPIDSHPNCRCAMVPETLTYQDLGLDIPDEERPPTAGSWFGDQSESTQRSMMGPKIFDAYQGGKLGLGDLVTSQTSRVWGKSSTVKSAKALGL